MSLYSTVLRLNPLAFWQFCSDIFKFVFFSLNSFRPRLLVVLGFKSEVGVLTWKFESHSSLLYILKNDHDFHDVTFSPSSSHHVTQPGNVPIGQLISRWQKTSWINEPPWTCQSNREICCWHKIIKLKVCRWLIDDTYDVYEHAVHLPWSPSLKMLHVELFVQSAGWMSH